MKAESSNLYFDIERQQHNNPEVVTNEYDWLASEGGHARMPVATRCPACGYLDATTVCRMCKTDKTRALDFHDGVPDNDHEKRDKETLSK